MRAHSSAYNSNCETSHNSNKTHKTGNLTTKTKDFTAPISHWGTHFIGAWLWFLLVWWLAEGGLHCFEGKTHTRGNQLAKLDKNIFELSGDQCKRVVTQLNYITGRQWQVVEALKTAVCMSPCVSHFSPLNECSCYKSSYTLLLDNELLCDWITSQGDSDKWLRHSNQLCVSVSRIKPSILTKDKLVVERTIQLRENTNQGWWCDLTAALNLLGILDPGFWQVSRSENRWLKPHNFAIENKACGAFLFHNRIAFCPFFHDKFCNQFKRCTQLKEKSLVKTNWNQ